MRNKINVRTLFGDNTKSMKLFYDWCINNDEFCDYDLEHLENDLFLGSLSGENYFHFHKGNILNFLEKYNYYIGIPIRGHFKYVTVVQFKSKKLSIGKPIYSNSGVKDRNRALELGIINAINQLEKNL